MKTVERGAALLDEKVPGWEDRIDLDFLDLERCDECVLGQVFRVNQHPAYERGLGILGLTPDDGRRFGFTIWRWRRGSWDRLDAAWRRLILKRRGQA